MNYFSSVGAHEETCFNKQSVFKSLFDPRPRKNLNFMVFIEFIEVFFFCLVQWTNKWFYQFWFSSWQDSSLAEKDQSNEYVIFSFQLRM